jgi:hypothetical protein
MSIYAKCEGCGKILNVPDGCEGRLIQCATCGKRMRVPNPAAHTAAEADRPTAAPAPPAAAPAAPVPVAPASQGLPEQKAAFFRALVEETEREQREAAAAKAAQKQAEAELAPLSEEAPAMPAKPPSAAPPHGGAPDEKDALFDALAEEEAREQRRTDAAQAAQAGAEAARAPLPASPKAIARGKSAAVTELRVKVVADKTGYDIAAPAAPPPPAVPTPAEFGQQPLRSRKLLGAAVAVLALIILLIIAIKVGLSSKPPAREAPVVGIQPAAVPSSEASPAAPPEMPPALKEAAGALADKAIVEVEVEETIADADAAALQTSILTPTGDVMLDLANLHIRDKSGADAGPEEMRAAIRSAVGKSVTAQLYEKGLTPVEAGNSAATPDQPHSRLKVLIRATPAWAAFDFRARPASNEAPPVQPVRPPRLLPPWMGRPRDIQYHSGPAALPQNPVKLWEQLLSGGLTIDARFFPDTAQNWSAIPAEDPQADLLPCGLRISIVRLAWEVGERTHDLIGGPAEADMALSRNAAEAGAALPFRRPKQVREMHLTGRMGPDRTCLISGFCRYEDVDLSDGAAEAGKLAAGLLGAPEADWNTFWDGKAGRDSLAAACRKILRLDGGPAVAAVMTATPDRLPPSSMDALASVLREEHGSPEWAVPFLAGGRCGDAALIALARRPKEEDRKYFLQWAAAPARHSQESLQAACCALIELGQPGPEVNVLIDSHAVRAFSAVRSPRACLAFPPQTAQTVLEWLIRSGTTSQQIGAVAAVVEGNIENLQDLVRTFVGHSLGSDPATLCRLCKEIEKAQSPLAFEILSSLAQRQLMQSDAGDRIPSPAAFPGGGGPPPAGRYSRTVAALVCAGLARFDKFKAGELLVRLMQSPGPATRYCAIETLIALDDVDACSDVRARFEELGKQARNAYEQQEWELVNPVKNKLCRYYIPLRVAENAVKNGINPKEVIETCNGIIKDNPSPAVVKEAQEFKRRAEKLLERK